MTSCLSHHLIACLVFLLPLCAHGFCQQQEPSSHSFQEIIERLKKRPQGRYSWKTVLEVKPIPAPLMEPHLVAALKLKPNELTAIESDYSFNNDVTQVREDYRRGKSTWYETSSQHQQVVAVELGAGSAASEKFRSAYETQVKIISHDELVTLNSTYGVTDSSQPTLWRRWAARRSPDESVERRQFPYSLNGEFVQIIESLVEVHGLDILDRSQSRLKLRTLNDLPVGIHVASRTLAKECIVSITSDAGAIVLSITQSDALGVALCVAKWRIRASEESSFIEESIEEYNYPDGTLALRNTSTVSRLEFDPSDRCETFESLVPNGTMVSDTRSSVAVQYEKVPGLSDEGVVSMIRRLSPDLESSRLRDLQQQSNQAPEKSSRKEILVVVGLALIVLLVIALRFLKKRRTFRSMWVFIYACLVSGCGGDDTSRSDTLIAIIDGKSRAELELASVERNVQSGREVINLNNQTGGRIDTARLVSTCTCLSVEVDSTTIIEQGATGRIFIYRATDIPGDFKAEIVDASANGGHSLTLLSVKFSVKWGVRIQQSSAGLIASVEAGTVTTQDLVYLDSDSGELESIESCEVDGLECVPEVNGSRKGLFSVSFRFRSLPPRGRLKGQLRGVARVVDGGINRRFEFSHPIVIDYIDSTLHLPYEVSLGFLRAGRYADKFVEIPEEFTVLDARVVRVTTGVTAKILREAGALRVSILPDVQVGLGEVVLLVQIRRQNAYAFWFQSVLSFVVAK